MAYGNLAVEDLRRTYKKRKPRRRTVVITRNRERAVSRKKNLRRMLAAVSLAACAGFMISQFIGVNETRSEIRSLNSELATQEAITSQKVFELEKSVDLGEIEKIAKTKLGMQRPEGYQTIYVNAKGSDVTETTAGDAEGIGNSISAFFGGIGSHIVRTFSIE